jgi:hypothetical protein
MLCSQLARQHSVMPRNANSAARSNAVRWVPRCDAVDPMFTMLPRLRR